MKTKTKGKKMQKYAYGHMEVAGATFYSLVSSLEDPKTFDNYWWCPNGDLTKSRGPFSSMLAAGDDYDRFLKAKAIATPAHPPKPQLLTVSKNVIQVDFINKKRIT